jgi:hypothetical protein
MVRPRRVGPVLRMSALQKDRGHAARNAHFSEASVPSHVRHQDDQCRGLDREGQ